MIFRFILSPLPSHIYNKQTNQPPCCSLRFHAISSQLHWISYKHAFGLNAFRETYKLNISQMQCWGKHLFAYSELSCKCWYSWAAVTSKILQRVCRHSSERDVSFIHCMKIWHRTVVINAIWWNHFILPLIVVHSCVAGFSSSWFQPEICPFNSKVCMWVVSILLSRRIAYCFHNHTREA